MDLWAVGVAILMLLLFGGVAYLVRRLGLGGAAGLLTKNSADIQVVGARRLDLNATLYIVEVEGRRLLVGSGRDGARLVADLTSEP
ncbi:flagellar biosynthetic protein FliO [Myxococcota bacterium]|nr:flagellar biosynthetic protein FliO [Myxococcota bacterium]